MACRDVTGFDAYVRERLARSKSEAARVVLEFVEKDRVNMGEAVLLAIEALPMRQTTDLRRIVDDFGLWCEWVEHWVAGGWTITGRRKPRALRDDQVRVVPPKNFNHRTQATPRADIVAVALGAKKVVLIYHHSSHDDNCPNCDVYKVTA